MKKTGWRIVIFSLCLVAVLAIPHFASASVATGIWPTGYWGPLVSCTGNYLNADGSPATTGVCTSVCDLIGTIVNIIYFTITICFFILVPVFFVMGGVMIMMSGTNPEMLSKGKSVITSTVVGLVIVLCSYLLVSTFIGFLNVTGVNIGGFTGGSDISCTSS